MPYPMKLAAPLKDYIWGGTRLKEEYGKTTDITPVAESWELSCHKDGMSVIASGEAEGATLAAWLEKHPEAMGTRATHLASFPLLVKLIDAEKDLSIQVHPDDDYARRVEGESGKTEMWYIVDAKPGASLLYGVKKPVAKDDFRRHIEDGTLTDDLARVPARPGDVFFIPAGTLHAICGGILICEIQQSSNTTYRVYDYGRLSKDGKPRELHVEKALDVANLAPLTPEALKSVVNAPLDIFCGARGRLLVHDPRFTVYELSIEDNAHLAAREDSFQTFTVLEGALTLLAGDEILSLGKGDTVFLPAGLGRYDLTGFGKLLLSKL